MIAAHANCFAVWVRHRIRLTGPSANFFILNTSPRQRLLIANPFGPSPSSWKKAAALQISAARWLCAREHRRSELDTLPSSTPVTLIALFFDIGPFSSCDAVGVWIARNAR